MMRKIEKKENFKGGQGVILLEHLLNDEQMDGMQKSR